MQDKQPIPGNALILDHSITFTMSTSEQDQNLYLEQIQSRENYVLKQQFFATILNFDEIFFSTLYPALGPHSAACLISRI